MIDMEISIEGLKFISTNEGFSEVVYDDVAGFPTIGFGHKLVPEDDSRYGTLEIVSTELALKILHDDVGHAVACVNECVETDINQNRFDALIDFVYNVGTHAFQNSTMLKFINSNDFENAANEFLKWTHAGGAIVQGLLNRREREKTLFETPI